MPQLTDKQERFCALYVQTWNATRAATEAGYSESSAYSIGWENLRKPEIATRINELIIATGEGATVSRSWVVHRLILEAVQSDKGSERIRALELLGRSIGLFTDRLEISEIPDSSVIKSWIDALEADIAASNPQ